MKISDFKGEAAFDLLADIIEPASKIFGDEEIRNIVTAKEGENKRDIGKAAAAVCKKHKKEAIEILAAVTGQTPEEFNANPFEIIALVASLLSEAMADVATVFFSPEQKTD